MNTSVKEYAEKQLKGRSRTRKYPIFPADIPPKLPKLQNIRAVLWDVYGTLLGHPMGDMVDHSLMEKSTRRAFRETAQVFGLEQVLDGDPAVSLREMYDREIEKIHRLKETCGIYSPEVRIERVWLRILRKLEKRGYKPRHNDVELAFAYKVAYFFDDVQQFKILYPGARRTLETIKSRGFRQGIVSNAQFYTPITLNILLRHTPDVEDEPMKRLFDKKLVFFSYQIGVGKPNPLPFERAKNRLAEEMNIKPGNVIYVGNDMLYDMVPARKIGFKSVLFAGDRRSITLRRDDREAAGFEPDAVIRSLPQLLEIISE